MTETMTIHRALSELKTMDDRVAQAINELCVCIPNQHSNKKIKGMSIGEFQEKIMKASYNKAKDLIDRRNAIKRAVVESNAKTMVNIDGVDYSVATAIEMKNHGIELEKVMLDQMVSQYSNAKRQIEANSTNVLMDKADSYISALFGSKDKIDSEETKRAKEDYISAHSYDMIDPMDVNAKIESYRTHIAAFEADVDSALSVSNALTTIEVVY